MVGEMDDATAAIAHRYRVAATVDGGGPGGAGRRRRRARHVATVDIPVPVAPATSTSIVHLNDRRRGGPTAGDRGKAPPTAAPATTTATSSGGGSATTSLVIGALAVLGSQRPACGSSCGGAAMAMTTPTPWSRHHPNPSRCRPSRRRLSNREPRAGHLAGRARTATGAGTGAVRLAAPLPRDRGDPCPPGGATKCTQPSSRSQSSPPRTSRRPSGWKPAICASGDRRARCGPARERSR